MKKIYLLITILCIVSMLVGCSVGPSNNSSSNKSSGELKWGSSKNLKGQTITIIWSDIEGPSGPHAKVLKQFTKETGIKVKEIGVNYNSVYDKVMTASMSNSSDIDLAEMDTIWAGQYLKGNVAYDLTKVVPKSYLKRFTQASLGSVTYDGHLVAMPYFTSSKHFYWNTKLLKKAGYNAPPKTWSEFRDMSKKLTKMGVYASGWSWKQAESLNCDYVSLVYGFGGKFFDANGKPVFNKGGGLKALQYMVDIMRKDKTVAPGSLQWDEGDVQNAFASGKIAMMSNWEGMYPFLNTPSKSSVVGQTDVGLMPGEGNVKSAVVSGSEGIALLKNSKHKQAALEFLKWMSSKNFQMYMFKNGANGFYPSLKSVYSDPEVKKEDKTQTLDKIVEQYSYGHNRPNAPGYVQWADILSSEIHQALSGTKSPKDALDTAADKINQAIKKAE